MQFNSHTETFMRINTENSFVKRRKDFPHSFLNDKVIVEINVINNVVLRKNESFIVVKYNFLIIINKIFILRFFI